MLKRAPSGPQNRFQQWNIQQLGPGSVTGPSAVMGTLSYDGVAGGKYQLINTLPLWKQLFQELITKPVLACDTETSGLHSQTADIIGWCFSWGAANSYYVPIRHVTMEKQLKPEDIWDDLRQLFDRPDLITIWHNAKFDLHFLWKEGLLPVGVMHDTRLMQSLLNETQGTTALKKLAVIEIHPQADKWEAAVDDFRAKFGRKHKIPKKNVHYGHIPLEIMTPYAASDAHYTWALYKKKLIEISRNSDLSNLYMMEMELLWALLAVEHRGVFIDRNHLETAAPTLEKKAAVLRAKIIQDLGAGVNPDSNVTLIAPLQKKGVKFYKKTKKETRFSLDSEVLKKLASRYQVCADIAEYRGCRKLKSTYVDSILGKLTEFSKLHCEYNQAVSTGRMSSKQPNLQNIPAKDKLIRRAFIPPKNIVCVGYVSSITPAASRAPCGFEKKGVVIPSKCPNCGGEVITREDYVLVMIDYSQMEVRMTAHYSRDPVLLDVYNKTFQDVHTRTMSESFGIKYDDIVAILEDENHPLFHEYNFKRKASKITNFLIIYGGGAKNLAAQLSTPQKPYTEKQSQKFIDNYFRKFRGIKKWIARTRLQILANLEIQNYFGRYRRFPELKEAKRKSGYSWQARWIVERCERQGVNFLIQGTCADLFKIAMARVNRIMIPLKSQLVMPIHDEIIFYWHRDEFGYMDEVKGQMEDFEFKVPMIVDVSWSNTNWAEKRALH